MLIVLDTCDVMVARDIEVASSRCFLVIL